MSAVNPYLPPTAAVEDVPVTSSFSQPRIWSWRGRIGRLRFFSYLSVAYMVLSMGLAALMPVLFAVMRSTRGQRIEELLPFVPLLLLVPYVVFAILCGIQRSHDMGWTGRTVLWCVVPLVGFVWLLKAGMPEANRFGKPPVANSIGVKISGILGAALLLLTLLVVFVLPTYDDYRTLGGPAQRAQP